jgi:hypothetical protein
MDFPRYRFFQTLCALFVAFVVVGDVLADSIHDATGACATASESSGHDDCPACGCTIHNGCAAAPDVAVAHCAPRNSADESFSVTDERPAPGAPPAIDHPPQLA